MLYDGYHFIFHPVEQKLVNADQDKIGQAINISSAMLSTIQGLAASLRLPAYKLAIRLDLA